MFAAELAVFAHREFLSVRLFVFRRVIVATCALFTSDMDIFTHSFFLIGESEDPITRGFWKRRRRLQYDHLRGLRSVYLLP